jgi:hypothetical protein
MTDRLLEAKEVVAELLAVAVGGACKRSVRCRFPACRGERVTGDARGRASVRRPGTDGGYRPAKGVPAQLGRHTRSGSTTGWDERDKNSRSPTLGG